MLDTPFPPWPSFTPEEVDAVADVLRSNRVNYWTGGECRNFEKEFAAWAGTNYAVALANGTVALDVALHALEIGAGDEVIVTPRTFMASASCVINAGATPIFAEVDAESGNLTAASIAAVITPRTKAVIIVHLGGWPVDLDPVVQLARAHSIAIIEDCAQAHGARYGGASIGSIGDIGAWSFCQDKIMTTGGEGGMVTTSDPKLWQRMWSFKDHGKSWDAVYNRSHPPGFRWVHETIGTNWRMLEVQAAIGRIQLRRMADWNAARTRNAAVLTRHLGPLADAGGPIRLPLLTCPHGGGDSCCTHGWYKYYFYLRPEKLCCDWTRDRAVEEINRAGVPCYHGSCSEAYLEKAFVDRQLGPPARLPIARALGETSVMMLVHPTLAANHMELAGKVAASVLRQAATA